MLTRVNTCEHLLRAVLWFVLMAQAARLGEWVLLDEVNLAPSDTLQRLSGMRCNVHAQLLLLLLLHTSSSSSTMRLPPYVFTKTVPFRMCAFLVLLLQMYTTRSCDTYVFIRWLVIDIVPITCMSASPCVRVCVRSVGCGDDG